MCFPKMTGAAASSSGPRLAAVHERWRQRDEQNLRQLALPPGRGPWQWEQLRISVDWRRSLAVAFGFRGLAFIVGVCVDILSTFGLV